MLRAEGVFSYSVEDRGGAAGFDGVKQSISAVGRYVLVASLEEKTRRTNITVYDLRNKFMGMNTPLPAGEKVKSCLRHPLPSLFLSLSLDPPTSRAPSVLLIREKCLREVSG